MGIDIWHARAIGPGFDTPVAEPQLSSPANDYLPMLSADRLDVYLSSDRAAAAGKGGFEIWRSHRTTIQDGFPAPALVEELNTSGAEHATWLSADNCRIYGATDVAGDLDLFVATRQPEP
jgi:hypothetical protein